MPVTEEERTALALSALGEIADPADVGDLLAVEEVEPGVVDVRFACRLAAYADWHWTVSTSDLPDVEPTVLEVELLPGEGSLLAPPWVPWAERLAEWRKQHPDERHPDDLADESEDDEDESDDEGAELDDDADEDDLAVDDSLDELDETELEGIESPEESEQDAGDISDEDEDDEDDDLGDDDRPARPGEVDRSL